MRPWLKPAGILHVLFFLSGTAGLVYEVVWTRWLTGLLGSASAATAIVLAVFMAGLGLGSWLSARVADRTARPIRLYAFLELAVVALVLLPVWEVGWSAVLFGKLAQWCGPVSPVLDLARFALAAIAIGPPTILMGASLPLVVRALASSPDSLGRRTATAYAANSLGGVVGTLLAGFMLIEMIGLRGTCLTAGGLGALAGLLALWLDRRSNRVPQGHPGLDAERSAAQDRLVPAKTHTPRKDRAKPVGPQTEAAAAPPVIAARVGASWILVAAAVSGFCALGYETIWCRVLSLLTLNTTYAFSLMLAILLFGLSLGSWLVRGRLDRLARPAELFVAIQILLSVYALLSLLWAPQLAGLADRVVPAGGRGPLQPWLGRPLVLATCLLLVPTTLMGASLPIACKLYGLLTQGVGRPVGRTYAANTLGSVLGSLVVGLIVIPSWGTWWAITLCALVGATAAAGVAWAYAVARYRPVFAALAAGAAAASLTLGITYGNAPVTRQGLGPQDKVCFRCEDAYGLVEVVEDQRIGTRVMFTNRLHTEGSTVPRTVEEQRKQGLLPLVLHPSPRRILEIGLGTGIKLGAMELPMVDTAVAVEISSGVIEASRWFADYNQRVTLADGSRESNIRVICADGRNFVALTPERFDVIVNGLLTPYRAGVSRLYTLEHFRACRAKLATDSDGPVSRGHTGGMFVVWVAIRQIAPEDLKVLTRTLLEVFPHTTIWLQGYYLAFVSTTQPAVWDAEQIQRRFADRPMREALDRAGLESPLGLLAGFIAGPPALGRFAAGQPLNTEDRPIIEFRTPRLGDRLNSRELAAVNLDILCALQEPLCPAYVRADRSTRVRLQQAHAARATANQAFVQKCLGQHIEAANLFAQALALDPSDDLARYEMEVYLVAHGEQCLQRGLLDQAYRVFQRAVHVNPRSIGALASLSALEEAAGNASEAEKLRRRALSLDPHNRRLRQRLAGLPRDGTKGLLLPRQ